MNNYSTHHQYHINRLLFKYSGDNSVIDIAELHGFLTAVASAPSHVHTDIWQACVFENCYCEVESCGGLESEVILNIAHRVLFHIQYILHTHPEKFEPVLYCFNSQGEKLFNAEDWCVGYMKAVALWPVQKLPQFLQENLDIIALHGLPENYAKLDNLPFYLHQKSITKITDAALVLFDQLHVDSFL